VVLDQRIVSPVQERDQRQRVEGAAQEGGTPEIAARDSQVRRGKGGHAQHGQDRSHTPTGQGQEDSLHHEVSHQAKTTRSQGQPHPDLLLLRSRPGQGHPRQVSADDQEQHGHEAPQACHGDQVPDTVLGRKAPIGVGPDRPALVGFRVFGAEAAEGRLEGGLGLGGAGAGPEAPQDLHREPLPVREEGFVALHAGVLNQGHPEIHQAQGHPGSPEAWGGNADDGVGDPVQRDDLAKDVGPSTEPILPEIMAQHRYRMLARTQVLGRKESPALGGEGAHHLEIRTRREGGVDPPDVVLRADGDVPLDPSGQRLQRRVRFLDGLEVGVAPPPPVRPVLHDDGIHDPVLARDAGNRGHPHRMDGREEGRVHTDSHGQGEHGDHRVAPGFPQGTKGETQVLGYVGEELLQSSPPDPSGIDSTATLRNLPGVPELLQGLCPCLFEGPALPYQLLDPGFQVEPDLIFDALVQPLAEAVEVEEPVPTGPFHRTASAETSRTERMARVLSSQPSSSEATALRPLLVIS